MTDLPYVDLYLRKSRVVRDEDPRDLTSIQSQENTGRAWAAREGYRVREVWVDNLSAWSDIERPEFDKALAAVLAGEVPALWCAFLDRFTRKGIDDIGPILGKARVIFDYEGLDSSIERDRRWIIDRAEQAREYSNRLSYNIKSTKATMRARGQWTQMAPYGLCADKARKLHHAPETWRIVLHVVKCVALGFSQRSVAKALNSGPNPVPGPGGGRWQANAISRILHNPVYEGWQVAPRRQKATRGRFEAFRDRDGNRVSVLADGVEPVPADLLARAWQVAAGFTFASPDQAARVGTTRELLTDAVKCPGCRGGASPDSQNYRCWRAVQGDVCPAPVSVSRARLEEYVTEAWFSWMNAAEPDDPLLVKAAQRWKGLQQPDNGSELAEAAAALKSAEAGIKRLVEQQASGFFDPPFDTHLPTLQAEARAALENAKRRVADASPKRLDVSFLLEDAAIRQAWAEADLPLRRELLRLVIRRVAVTKGRRGCNVFDGPSRVEIHWLDQPDPWLKPKDQGSFAAAA
ncbi:resolvase-like protein [Kitasatospora sp. SolWspMP-SS2h]|uniref:recombinase family protein n=1 Tax=Kitasatospora sp. SolWspMP-SS2h TaxID=1305729 RepID=UPI000DB9EC98|nr:recombinase family protein [Kitasatospora sp. SolWspMP-SS2h]RAJ44745.1 resolvase-like protein [Kitasatospora sp. SolWspMP-SS2h]